MITRRINLPTLGLIAGTRVALGAGLGLLVGNRLNSQQRQACGWALFAVGALTTIPLALQVLRGGEENAPSNGDHRHRRATPRHRGVHAATR